MATVKSLYDLIKKEHAEGKAKSLWASNRWCLWSRCISNHQSGTCFICGKEREWLISKLKPLILVVRVKGMKKIDDKKIKGISIELDRSTKLNELDDTINEFREKTDNKHEIDVRIDIMNSTLHMKRLKKPHLKLATKDGKKIDQKDDILVKHIDDKD